MSVKMCLSSSYTPGLVAPKHWSICSIVGDTSQQLNTKSLKKFGENVDTQVAIRGRMLVSDESSFAENERERK